MKVKGSAFSLRIGKDIKEARTAKTEAFKATTRLSGRYKKLEEQKEENRKSYTEKEIFIEKPVAPPRNKRDKRQVCETFFSINWHLCFFFSELSVPKQPGTCK